MSPAGDRWAATEGLQEDSPVEDRASMISAQCLKRFIGLEPRPYSPAATRCGSSVQTILRFSMLDPSGGLLCFVKLVLAADGLCRPADIATRPLDLQELVLLPPHRPFGKELIDE